MKKHNLIVIAIVAIVGAAYVLAKGRPPGSWVISGLLTVLGWYAVINLAPPAEPVIVKLGKMKWTRRDFCRGWLITGDTGSGKTTSGITQLMYQVFKNEPNWGGLCIDDKGVYWEVLQRMARKFGRQDDLILLQVRPDNASPRWKPYHTFNLTSDRQIPFSTLAQFVIDTGRSIDQQGDKSFFTNQARTHITFAMQALHELGFVVTLENVFGMLLEKDGMERMIQKLLFLPASESRDLLLEHLQNHYQAQPPEQRAGVRETIANYLHNFQAKEMVEVFCAENNTFEMADVDKGKIICVSTPLKYQTERRYVNTFLKQLFYTHALRRFNRPESERINDNLLILLADEAQHFVTASEDGISDYNTIDRLREANTTIIAATQSTSSFIPPLGKEKAIVFLLNLRNRIIFKSTDEPCALSSAEFLGKKPVRQKTWGYSAGQYTRSYTEIDEFKIKPHLLRALAKHNCVLVHCENRHEQTVLPPLTPEGKVAPWFVG